MQECPNTRFPSQAFPFYATLTSSCLVWVQLDVGLKSELPEEGGACCYRVQD